MGARLLSLRSRLRSFRARLRALLIGGTVTIGALLATSFPLSVLYVLSQTSGNALLPADCAIVFGAAVHRGGDPGPGIVRRTAAAAELWHEGMVGTLILTGGLGEGNSVSEAQAMRAEALRLGIPSEVIRTEEGATSTWQNLQFSRPFLRDCSTLVAVSDRYHLARIRLAAFRQGLPLTLSPAAPAEPLFEFFAIMREAVGTLIYLVWPI